MRSTNLILILIAALLFPSLAAAQKSVPKTKTVNQAAWKEFTSEEGGYKVKFPLAPTRFVTTIDTSFGKADFVQQRVVLRNMAMVVGYMDYPSPITDKDELKYRYDGAVTNVLNKTGNRLVSSTDVFVNDFLGREAVFESESLWQTQRAYFVNQRFFALSVIMQVNKKPTAKDKTEYDELKAKLFESFAVTKIPEANFMALKLPDDFGSTFDGDTYRSKYFGFSVKLPTGFSFFDQEQMAMVLEMTKNEADLQEIEGEKIKLSLKRSALLAGAYSETEASIIIGAELPSFSNMTLEAIAKEFVNETKKNLSEKIIKDLHPVMLDGVKAYGMITQNFDDKTKQYLILTKRKDLVFQIVYSYKDDSELAKFTEMLNSVKFEK